MQKIYPESENNIYQNVRPLNFRCAVPPNAAESSTAKLALISAALHAAAVGNAVTSSAI